MTTDNDDLLQLMRPKYGDAERRPDERASMTGMVRAFHEKHGFAVGRELHTGATPSDRSDVVTSVAARLRAAIPRVGIDDLRVARLNLIVEECAELAEALLARDKALVLDALADLAYVVVGTAVAYGLPLEAAFDEVHRSNMTKEADGTHKPAKGPDYQPPQLTRLVQALRAIDLATGDQRGTQ